MARLWAKFEGDVKRLISSITGFQDHEENFGLCLQFAQSNILYHQFLSVDSHKIGRALKGLEEKFAVHSDEKKAKAFQDLTETFLQNPAFEHREQGKTDTHYAVLSLLVSLAQAPTRIKYQPTKHRKQQEVEDDFDWAAYLMEGEDVYNGPFPPTPEFSDDEEEDECGASSRPAVRYYSPRARSVLPGPADAPRTQMACEGGETQTDTEWLTQNVVLQYWDGRSAQRADVARSRETTLSSDWDDFLLSQNPLYVPAHDVTLTEHQVLREVLWMVAGLKTSFVFEVKDNKFSVRPDIQMAHLTKDTLTNFLTEATQYGNIVLRLSTFVEEVTSLLCRFDDQGRPDMRTCQTHQAFVGVLSTVIREFRDRLIVIEKETALQEDPATLLGVMEQLRRWFPQLDLLNKVYEEGVVAVYDRSNVERASHLLSVLFSVLIDLDTLGQDADTVVLFLRIWCQTSRPYWDMVNGWISKGKLSDPYREFLIQRNNSVTSLDEDFWNTAFTLYTPSTDHSGDTSQPSESRPVRGAHQRQKTRKADKTEADKTETDGSKPLIPEFLQPVLRQIILAGKSMEMLQALGRLGDIVEDHQTKDGVRDSLYESFVKSLQTHIGTKSEEPGTETVDTADSQSTPQESFSAQINNQVKVKGVYDPLLQKNFAAIFDRDVFRYKSLMDKEKILEQRINSLDVGHLVPIQLLLNKCLYPGIISRYQHVCRHLLEVLKTDYHLLNYFAAMRYFFLMEAGDTMYDFYTEVFDKLRLHEQWQDMSFLNMSLHESLTSHFPEHIDHLFVSVSDVSGDQDDVTHRIRDRHPINALDDLKMHYKTPWPINVVLNTQSFKVYNAVFSFLLQIKRSKYCLDRLRFYDLQRVPDVPSHDSADHFGLHSAHHAATRDDRIHRMQLFRMKLMHFINSLHNYIMTRILQSTGLEFQDALSRAEDLDDVIRLHTTYVGHLHERCLLHHMVRFLKVAVTKVMSLALSFQVCWDEGVDSVSEKHLAGMETEFSRCIQFLGSFLNNVVKKGSHPDLESLAYSLLTSSERGKNQDTKSGSF